jgi:hypothetical protein
MVHYRSGSQFHVEIVPGFWCPREKGGFIVGSHNEAVAETRYGFENIERGVRMPFRQQATERGISVR